MEYTGKQKYRNKITEIDGIKFHSQKEARRWQELKMLIKANKISDLERQVKFSLDVNGAHICIVGQFDMLLFENTGPDFGPMR
jgi:hypothetical protein